MRRKAKKTLKAALFLVFCGFLLYMLCLNPWGSMCLTPAGRQTIIEKLDLWVRSAGAFGSALFIAVYSLAILALPATPFTAAGAFLFGKYLGTLYNFIADIIGASLSFLLGRYFLRDFARGFLKGRLGQLDRKVGEHGFSFIFYLRILWFPFIVLNYAAGATRVRFSEYFWGTFFGILPAVVIVSFFFGSLREIIASYRGPADLFQFNILFPACLLGFSFFLPSIVKRLRKTPMPELENGDDEDE